VYYSTLEEAKQVVESSKEIKLKGNILQMDYAERGEGLPNKHAYICSLQLYTCNSASSDLYHVFKIDDGMNRGTHEPTSTLFVGNLPMKITESLLATTFSGCVSVRIVIEKMTGRSKG